MDDGVKGAELEQVLVPRYQSALPVPVAAAPAHLSLH